MQETHSAWVVAAGVLLVAVGLVASFFAVPALIHGMVTEKVALKDGSEALGRFRKTPQPLHFHVYLFHVENPEEVSGQGARPVLTEKGPYVYDMYKERVDLEFHDQDDSVSYFPKNTYYFNKDKSGCRSESDAVTVIHAPILGTALKLQQVSAMGLGIFNDAVPLLFKDKNIFLTTTVGELLFRGVFINCSFPADSFPAGAVCQGMRQRAPATYRRAGADFYFSMFAQLNGTSKDRVRMSRGQADASTVGRVVAVAENATLATWRPGTSCNLINGTDGTIFAPFQRGATVLPIYTPASCRSLYLFYKEDTELSGVTVMRFVIDSNMLASGKEYAPNLCFCVAPPEEDLGPEEEDEEGGRRRRREAMSVEEREMQACLPNGTMNLAPCSGAPVILSFPHFYLADDKLLNYPIGLSPNEEAHQTIVDIEPVTGTPMRAKKRVQLNMFLKKIENFNYLSTVGEGLFPILWMEEGITLEGPSLDKIVSAGRGMAVLRALPWVVAVVGAVLGLIGVLFLVGLAQAVLAACQPRSPRVQQGQGQGTNTGGGGAELPLGSLSPPATPVAGNFRLAMGFVPGDAAFVHKTGHFANNINSNNNGRVFVDPNYAAVSPAYRGVYGDPAGAGLQYQRPGKIRT